MLKELPSTAPRAVAGAEARGPRLGRVAPPDPSCPWVASSTASRRLVVGMRVSSEAGEGVAESAGSAGLGASQSVTGTTGRGQAEAWRCVHVVAALADMGRLEEACWR